MIRIKNIDPVLDEVKQAVLDRDNRKQFRFEAELPPRKPLNGIEATKYAAQYLELPDAKVINNHD